MIKGDHMLVGTLYAILLANGEYESEPAVKMTMNEAYDVDVEEAGWNELVVYASYATAKERLKDFPGGEIRRVRHLMTNEDSDREREEWRRGEETRRSLKALVTAD